MLHKSILISAMTATILSVAIPVLAQETQSNTKGDRALAAAPVQDDKKPAVSLPNGAASINEVYGDWTVGFHAELSRLGA